MASELNGPSLFPRAIRPGSDFGGAQLPSDAKNLESVHNVMKSLELKSPERIKNEAKKIVDGGLELLQSDLTSFAENVGISDAIAPKRTDRPQERRQGLGLARKRAPFSLKSKVSLASLPVEPTVNIDQLQDPDDFFDEYEKMENAKREIQRQMGINPDNFVDFENYKPSNQPRQRRPGMLGVRKSYKHRFSSTSFRNDDSLISSQETMEQDVPGLPKEDLEDQSAAIDPNPDVVIAEAGDELNVPTKKAAGEFSEMLEDLLSCSNDDLEGDGALNILQERLNIKPLDLDKLRMPDITDVGITAKSIGGKSLQNSQRSLFDGALRIGNWRQHSEHENVSTFNNKSSPTPPRSPFAALQLLNKKILQTNPLTDPFSPLHVSTSSAQRNSSLVRPMLEFHEQVDEPEDLAMCKELGSRVGNLDDKKSTISNMEAEKVMQHADDHEYVDHDQSAQNMIVDLGPDDASNDKNEKTTEVHEEPHSSEPEETLGNAPIQQHEGQNQEARQPKARRGKRKASETAPIKKAQPSRKSRLANPSQVEGTVDNEAIKQHDVLEQQQEACQANAQRGKRKPRESRISKSHPMRKSLAESGTTYVDGLRRSKRIRSRPLEYWNGERFLYGRVNDELKLVGVKYISPGKDSKDLKVKSYLSPETSAFKMVLEMA